MGAVPRGVLSDQRRIAQPMGLHSRAAHRLSNLYVFAAGRAKGQCSDGDQSGGPRLAPTAPNSAGRLAHSLELQGR